MIVAIKDVLTDKKILARPIVTGVLRVSAGHERVRVILEKEGFPMDKVEIKRIAMTACTVEVL